MKRYEILKTTTHQAIEIGSRIKQEGAPPFGLPIEPIQGVVTKMEDCDSGLFIFIKKDNGEAAKVHVQFDIPYGVRMHNSGITTTILKSAPKQFSLVAA
jgi:hypothetical protein